MAQYGTIITNIGLAQIANAQITQTKVGLEYIALGDGNGAHYVPKQNQTALVHEVWRGPIAELSIDPTNSNRIIIDAVIPVTAGGFTIREIGIFDDKNNLIAVGQYPEKYKPQLSEGVSEETLIHFVIETNNADVVKLTIDPTVIIASRNYVDGKVAQVQTALTEHSGQDVLSEDGAHGIRFFNDQLAVKDKDNQDQWNVVELGGSGEVYQENVTMNDKANALGYATFAGSVTYVSRNGYVNPATNQIVVVDSTGLATGDSIILKYNTGALENATITEMTAIDAKGVSTITVSTTAVLSQNITHIMKLGGTNTIQMAEGYSTVASGNYSHAEGSNTTARGQRSHAEGYATTAKGDGSHAEGNSTFAVGSNSHAEGQSSIASGSSSHAEGTSTLASGGNSHAEGNNTEATGANSHAEGSGTKATGHTSHAEGGYTVAAGQSSHAEGNGSYANGNYSHAEGANTIAFGESSHSEGNDTTAEGSHSHAEGLGTLAGVLASHAQGRYNKQMTGSGTAVVQTDDAFVIGNGVGPTGRGNAFRVRFNGSTYGVGAWNSTGADYAEYFEWLDGNVDNEDRVGFVVALDGVKIRKATSDDSYILGIVSANPSVIGDSHQDDWNGKYVTDEWGRIQYHWADVKYDERITVHTENGMHNETVTKTRRDYVPVLNPDWNNDEEYIPREERKEWDAVGLIGKLLVRDDGTCEVNSYAKVGGEEGTLTASNYRTDMRVIERVSPSIIRVFIK